MNDFFRQWRKDVNDAIRGKIWVQSGCGWVLGDTGYVNPQGVKTPVRTDQDGNQMSIAKGKFSTNCPRPPHDAPRLHSGYSVKHSACLKCPHRLPQACCALLKDRDKDARKDAMKTILTAISDAHKIVETP